MNHFVRFGLPREDRTGPTLGPFRDYVQLTYGLLRIGPDGADLATMAGDNHWWIIDEVLPEGAQHGPWSDVVIYAEADEGTVEMCPYCLCTDGDHNSDCEGEKLASGEFVLNAAGELVEAP